ncbi:hypothetical protein ACR6LM_001439 [Enterococcus faecalis]|uniref:hypothetical protein n=1 Tax=Enterococcus faecalis TaxID=1351 RepID=UPI001159A68E|nr:hypothetical protein [Enterococcus faecalis]MDN3138841.1 hypothetical protein [Enterococcus faecalis]
MHDNDIRLQLNMEMRNVGEFLFIGCEALYNTGEAILDYEIFNIFYNISVGIERIQKIILLLDENKIENNQKKFLTQHNLEILKSMIAEIHNVNFSKKENKIFNLLTDFYRNGRYNYIDENFTDFNWSIKKLDAYLKSEKLPPLNRFFTQYSFSIDSKKSIITSLSIILSTYIKLLKKVSDENNLYVLETQSNFKLSIFYYGSLNKKGIFNYFEMADIAKNEIYYFFLKDSLETIDEDILTFFPPLEFDSALIPDFLSEKTLFKVKWDMIDTVEACYYDLYEDDIKKIEERKHFMLYLPEYISQTI